MIILKFGGTSVSTRKSIETICQIVQSEYAQQPVVVVSAMKGVTDALLTVTRTQRDKQKDLLKMIRQKHLRLINTLFSRKDKEQVLAHIDEYLLQIRYILITKEFEHKEDLVVSYGERISSYIVTMALRSCGVPAQQMIATELIVMDNKLKQADFLPKETKERMQKLHIFIDNGIIPVVTGFIGATKNGRVTTLGRGGSDYSAAIIGACLEAREIQIWTDVDGIFTADPNIFKKAKQFKKLSYKKAQMIALQGAKVLHPQTIRPAFQAAIPVRVLNIFHPKNTGTLIC